MTLAELRSRVRFNIFSDGNDDAATDAKINAQINSSMHHVSTWARSVNPEILIAGNTYAVQAPDAAGLSLGTTAGFYTRVKKIRFAKRTTVDATTDPWLDVVEWESIQSRRNTLSKKPAVFVQNDAVGFYQSEAIDVLVYFWLGLPDMTADTDTPGQAAGVGDVNRLPVEYHDMIASWTAHLMLTGEGASGADKWRTIYDEMKLQLIASLISASRTAEKG